MSTFSWVRARLRWLLFDPAAAWPVMLILLVAESVLGLLIIRFVRYTEIDWKAYMQEVQGVLDGEYDYLNLHGGTGPLVYPAGFVWLFAALHRLTGADPSCCRWPVNEVTESARCVSGGGDIRAAQYLFLLLYVCTQAVVMDLYRRSRSVPPWAFVLLCLSLRVHSLYVLRLFNDCVASFLLYSFVHCFACGRYTAGSLLFSAAVSVKMNALLFAPALGVLLVGRGGWTSTLLRALPCALLQLALALPFLQANAAGYLSKAFELSRQFEYKWTVNFQMLSPGTFASRPLSVGLLVVHVGLLICFAHYRWCATQGGLGRVLRGRLAPACIASGPPVARATAAVCLSCNFIGIAASRTLHYQFYAWYFHSLPFLLWHARLPTLVRLMVWLGIEAGFITFPATPASSALLQAAHGVLLYGLWRVPAADYSSQASVPGSGAKAGHSS